MAAKADLAALVEGQVLDGVDLTRAEAVALDASRLVSVQPSATGWRVTAAYAVGALQVGDLEVRVTAKVGVVQVLTLLARAHGIRHLDVDPHRLGLARDADLTTVLAVLFAREAETALAAGPLRGYRTEEQSLPVLRGRLRVREQETRRFGVLHPLEVTVDEWTLDTDENRRLRAATLRLLAMPGLPTADRRRLLHVDRLLAEVRTPGAGAPLAPWRPTRLNARLQPLLRLADLVLDGAGVEHQVGGVVARGFVLSLATLFEALVTRLLQEAAAGVRVVAQRSLPLDTCRRMRIQPDLVVERAGRTIAVADTKYKLLDAAGRFPAADAYQLLAYCLRLGLPEAHLVYAGGDPEPDPYVVVDHPERLVVHAVRIDRPIPEIEADVAALLDRLAGAAVETGERSKGPRRPGG